MRLGWRNPFKGNPERALTDLEQKLVKPHASLGRTTDQTVNASAYVVAWETAVDPFDMWQSGTDIAIPSDHQRWWLSGSVTAALTMSASAGRRVLDVLVDGTSVGGQGLNLQTGTNPLRMTAAFDLEVAANQVITVSFTNTTASNDSLLDVQFGCALSPLT